MCQTHEHLENYRKFNWDGDEIVHDPSVTGARTVPGEGKSYELDLRELLLNEHNSVIGRALDTIRDQLSPRQRALFNSKARGAFDFKMAVLREFVESQIAYVDYGSIGPEWLFPDETLMLRRGDCEDRAMLLAALAFASGVSSYSLRVVLGRIREPGRRRFHDHVWVVYKNEAGIWQQLELAEYGQSAPTRRQVQLAASISTAAEYVPIYAFNTDHVWYVRNAMQENSFDSYVRHRRFWADYSPTFAYGVHQAIIQAAITPAAFVGKVPQATREGMFYINWSKQPVDYLNKFASMVANVDLTLNYRQEVHFDNGRVFEAASLLKKNLASGRLADFAMACHSIADFYSHTSFGHFAKRVPGSPDKLQLAAFTGPAGNPVNGAQLAAPPDYGAGAFDFRRFTTNPKVFRGTNPATGKPVTLNDAMTFWGGRILSGRFGQHGDSQSILEATQYADENLPDYYMGGALPHHNEIAVDDAGGSSEHKLYSAKDYQAQFDLRRDAAIRHTAQLFTQWKPK